MKAIKTLMIIAATLCCGMNAFAQTKGDAILGEYYLKDAKNGDSKVLFTKNSSGTYDCEITWIEIPDDPKTGKPWLDVRNPDKSLRGRQVLGIKIIEGIPYDEESGTWTGAKIYDPNRGIKANATIKLCNDGRLKVSGKVLGIGETQYWDRL